MSVAHSDAQTLTSAQSRNQVAIDFLEAMSGYPVLVLAFRPDRKGQDAKTCHNREQLRAFLEAYNGNRNIYWQVNPAIVLQDKKSEKQNIKAMRFIHADIDPRSGEALEQVIERANAAFQASGLPKPSAAVCSGNGVHLYWRLLEPLTVEGEGTGRVAAWSQPERYNQEMIALLGADKSTFNVDRILRVPGTKNIPDSTKVNRGYETRDAYLIDVNDSSYPIGMFKQAPLQAKPAKSNEKVKVEIDSDGIKIADINELDRWKVEDRLKVIAVQGRHPDEPKEDDNSRSQWVFDFCCNMVRHGVPDEVLLGILMDPTWGISESILDKGGGARRYAIRQIERAKEEAIEPTLAEMNEQYFVALKDGKRSSVCWWDTTSTGDAVLETMSCDAFKEAHMNKFFNDIDGKKQNKAKWWLTHPQRREFKKIVFDPSSSEEEVNGCFNMWRGFAVEPKQGDWSLMRQHIREVLASGNAAHAEYIVRWAAWAVQNPGAVSEVTLVLRGGEGVGKGIFLRALKRIFGDQGRQISSPKHLVGNFNAHLRNCCFLFADEAFAPDDRVAVGVLKTLISEPTLMIEAKGKDVLEEPNRVKLGMASNEDWVVPAGEDPRRFAVFQVLNRFDGWQKNKTLETAKDDYFDALATELQSGGLEAMLYDLLQMDLQSWHPRKLIRTEALIEQQVHGLRGAKRVVLGLLQSAEFPLPKSALTEDLRRQGYVVTEDLARNAFEQFGEHVRTNQLGELLGKIGFTPHRVGPQKVRCFRPPPLPEARTLAVQVLKLDVPFDNQTVWSGIGGQELETRMINQGKLW